MEQIKIQTKSYILYFFNGEETFKQIPSNYNKDSNIKRKSYI